MNPSKTFRILVINPGSTSTKIAVYENDDPVVEQSVQHRPEEFKGCASTLEQRDIRYGHVMRMLEAHGIPPESLDAVVGRGGIIRPIESGTYHINEKMKQDLIDNSATVHASALGGLLAADLGERYGIPSYVVDPVVVDEMEQLAKLSGVPGIERRSIFHALNAKSVVRKVARELGVKYEDGRFVVAHMGGGITVGAHRYGRVIDVNDGISGEGPFSPERCGTVPLGPVIDMCYSGKFTREEMTAFLSKSGGMLAYLGTNDMRLAEKYIRNGDDYAALVMDSMAYQVSKEIGAMVAVLEGRLNAIILTGGLAYSHRFTASIKQRVDQIAPVITYPGENELAALAEGALRVLRGEENVKEYA
ncbi:butyrate kinase [Sporobacter termitidis DSM 10068]|uniref:Probable butyrate kinase n=1 Tax=Sporobacter termitidis DSM 10068 TaxID=1123282 RepID=A0A1M5UUU2_9FIRM|nr:butyrate kinase [Sporobacter termitidis]SHH66751.1 butyrate kinase [Sporobacter termitidis DSM 10068]